MRCGHVRSPGGRLRERARPSTVVDDQGTNPGGGGGGWDFVILGGHFAGETILSDAGTRTLSHQGSVYFSSD